MTKQLTRLVGDIHGLFNDYKAYAIDKFEGPHIQVGAYRDWETDRKSVV